LHPESRINHPPGSAHIDINEADELDRQHTPARWKSVATAKGDQPIRPIYTAQDTVNFFLITILGQGCASIEHTYTDRDIRYNKE
jgi:hypothetical protein